MADPATALPLHIKEEEDTIEEAGEEDTMAALAVPTAEAAAATKAT